MAYYLTIDIGNSSAKAAVWHDDEICQPVSSGQLTASDLQRLAQVSDGRFDAVAICTVAELDSPLLRAAKSLSQRVINVDASVPMPISLSRYLTTGTLGADRIAALAGAQALMPGEEVLVIDCGTAITYDRLSSTGEFLGGNIAPGVSMRLRALHEFTARLPKVEPTGDCPLWGTTTATAMQAGALYGAVAEAAYYAQNEPEGTRLLFTGGQSDAIAAHLPFETTVDHDLVLRGLKYIIDYNENK